MPTINVIPDHEYFFPEDYYIAKERPEGLPLTAITISIERSRAVLNGLFACAETHTDGFVLTHRDVVHCLYTIDAMLAQVEDMIKSTSGEI